VCVCVRVRVRVHARATWAVFTKPGIRITPLNVTPTPWNRYFFYSSQMTYGNPPFKKM
jgi:hypothetical protein